MNNQLAVIEPEQFEVTQRVAKAMAASGYFQDAKDIAQAVTKIMAGQEMGLPPFASMTNIHIIKGKPVLGANALATLIKQHPSYDYRVKSISAKGCTVTFYEDGKAIGDSSFGPADAKAAGLNGGNWVKFPRNMYFARAISNGAKWFTPGIFGGAPVYTPDELGADVDGEGEIIGEMSQAEPVVIDGRTAVEAKLARGERVEPDDFFEDEPQPEQPADDGPLPDDEQVIYEASAADFFVNVLALIDRYNNVPHAKNALKQLGYNGVPRSKMKRVEMYRALKELAAHRDVEDAEAEFEAEQEPLFDDVPQDGAYAEAE